MYDPALGRFIQPDSIIPDPGSAKGYDRYAYVNNNPINFNDPSGHTEACDANWGGDDCGESAEEFKFKDPEFKFDYLEYLQELLSAAIDCAEKNGCPFTLTIAANGQVTSVLYRLPKGVIPSGTAAAVSVATIAIAPISNLVENVEKGNSVYTTVADAFVDVGEATVSLGFGTVGTLAGGPWVGAGAAIAADMTIKTFIVDGSNLREYLAYGALVDHLSPKSYDYIVDQYRNVYPQSWFAGYPQ